MDTKERHETKLSEFLVSVAECIGRPVIFSCGNMIEYLVPTDPDRARPRSLSKRFGKGKLPFHVDMAHWLIPCRYILLACVDAGTDGAATLLASINYSSFTEGTLATANQEQYLVQNGRNSFFSTVLNTKREFVRFDPGCMEPVTENGSEIIKVVGSGKMLKMVIRIVWEPGMILLVDNWHILHSREDANNDSERKLLRVCVY